MATKEITAAFTTQRAVNLARSKWIAASGEVERAERRKALDKAVFDAATAYARLTPQDLRAIAKEQDV